MRQTGEENGNQDSSKQEKKNVRCKVEDGEQRKKQAGYLCRVPNYFTVSGRLIHFSHRLSGNHQVKFIEK